MCFWIFWTFHKIQKGSKDVQKNSLIVLCVPSKIADKKSIFPPEKSRKILLSHIVFLYPFY